MTDRAATYSCGDLESGQTVILREAPRSGFRSPGKPGADRRIFTMGGRIFPSPRFPGVARKRSSVRGAGDSSVALERLVAVQRGQCLAKQPLAARTVGPSATVREGGLRDVPAAVSTAMTPVLAEATRNLRSPTTPHALTDPRTPLNRQSHRDAAVPRRALAQNDRWFPDSEKRFFSRTENPACFAIPRGCGRPTPSATGRPSPPTAFLLVPRNGRRPLPQTAGYPLVITPG